MGNEGPPPNTFLAVAQRGKSFLKIDENASLEVSVPNFAGIFCCSTNTPITMATNMIMRTNIKAD